MTWTMHMTFKCRGDKTGETKLMHLESNFLAKGEMEVPREEGGGSS